MSPDASAIAIESKRVKTILVRPEYLKAIIDHYRIQGWTIAQVDTVRTPDQSQIDYLVRIERLCC